MQVDVGIDRFLAQGIGQTSDASTATLVEAEMQAAERIVLAQGFAIGDDGSSLQVRGFGAVNQENGELEFSCETGSNLLIQVSASNNNRLSLQVTGPSAAVNWRGLLRLELQVE